ncbi:MAG: hypothetical protein K0S29_1232, partial [Gammaproteobacteria bacterium]|nr:hypothetical protein [Gammaproteobacteria bacterium]
MFDGFLFPFQQYNSKKKLLSDSSLLARQKLLKIKAKSLSSLNKNINTFKQWINQALTVAGFLLMIHPVHSRLLPLVNSGVPVMVDKITQYWITYKTAEFR